MRSFTLFATLAAIVALCFASPMFEDASAIAARGEKTVPAILHQVIGDLDIAFLPLNYVTKNNATIADITPVIHNVKQILQVGIDDITDVLNQGGVVNGALGAVLSLAGNLLSVLDLCQILSLLIHVIFGALNAVLIVVSDTEKNGLLPLLQEVVVILCELLQLVFGVLGDVVKLLLPLILDVAGIASSLGVTGLLGGIGLPL
ncbi:hypothetical protein L218DRAFT_945373 [Marasmius fiardii PR-910]|nr:hypothetical protein L218DRAFT_945373 [Marasmius fiardii PR-910]